MVGHVDHGKSTLVGRLLADTQSLPEGKLEAIRDRCAKNSKPMEYAYLLDALKDEQSQGITIDSARCFFKTKTRDYIIIDAPGHIEFLKNMVSGAARADAALLVIDAHEGVRENSRRHGYFLSMLGIDQFVVVINKMDIEGYRQDVFDRIEKEYRAFLDQIGLKAVCFIPVNSRDGVNVAGRSAETPWYKGPTVLEVFDRFGRRGDDETRPLRLPVQDVYKFTAMGDDRRIIAGRIEAGAIRVGDSLLFSPSNKRARVSRIEAFNAPQRELVPAGESVGVTLDEQIYVTRGELVSRADQPPPQVGYRIRVDLFWLGRQPMTPDKVYKFKLGTTEVPVQVEKIIHVLDASSLDAAEGRKSIERHEVAECILETRKPIAFDIYADASKTSRFVIIDEYTIAGGGIIREALADEENELRREAFLRDIKWIRGQITPEMRSERYDQRAALVVVTGHKGVGRKQLARAVERKLFELGRMVYYLGMGSVVHGLDADIDRNVLGSDKSSREHIRRLGEVLHVLLDAGLIVICTAMDLSKRNLHDIEALVNPASMITVRIGDSAEGETDLQFAAPCAVDHALPAVIEQLRVSQIIPALDAP